MQVQETVLGSNEPVVRKDDCIWFTFLDKRCVVTLQLLVELFTITCQRQLTGGAILEEMSPCEYFQRVEAEKSRRGSRGSTVTSTGSCWQSVRCVPPRTAAAAAHVHKKTELKASGGRRPSQTIEAAGGAQEFFSCIYRKHFWLLSFQREPQRVLSNHLLSRLSRVLSAGSQQDGRVKSMF